MIAITISDAAYAAIAPTLPSDYAVQPFDGQCKIWVSEGVVNHLRALREPSETFSDVILRLAARGSCAALTR